MALIKGTALEHRLSDKLKATRAILSRLGVELDKDGNTVISLDGHEIVAVIASPEAIALRAFETERRAALAQ